MSHLIISIGIFIFSSVKSAVDLIKAYRNRKKTKKELKNEALDFVLINLSGNPLSNQAREKIMTWGKCAIIEINRINIDLSNPITYMENVVNTCSDALKYLIKREGIFNNLLKGRYIIIPPGLTSIAMVFITMLRGISGHFPRMSFFYKKDMEYDITEPFDFQNLRNKYRDILKSQIKDEPPHFVIINLHGRYFSHEAIDTVMKWGNFDREKDVIEKFIPTLDLSNMDNIVAFCDKTIDELIKIDQISYSLPSGKYIVIPTGNIAIATVFTVMFNGITGYFPKMSFYYYKKMVGYNLIKPHDFEDLFLRFREIS